MLIGAQVRQTGGFVAALRRAEDMGAEVVQLCAQNNRQWRMPDRPPEEYSAYRDAAAASRVVKVTVCHAPYLVNVISPDRVTADRSYSSLVANLRAADALGARSLVLHPGSHRGVEPESALRRTGALCRRALDEAAQTGQPRCDLLLENTAGSGDTVGRTFAELAAIIEAAGGDERIGICLDTQHLFASGVSFGTVPQADAVVAQIDEAVGLGRLRCLHCNDSKIVLGANRDRHENLGQGFIGKAGLRALLGHPHLAGLPAVLEVPGIDGGGPGHKDLAEARALLAAGMKARAGARARASARAEAAPQS